MKKSNSITALALVALFTSCKTIKYVPVETVKTDTTYINKEKWDSIYVHDSVFVHERGETLFVEKTKYKYIERVLRDTVYKSRIDSIQIPYPVEKPLTWAQHTAIKFFPWLLVAVTALLVWTFRKPLARLLKLLKLPP